jgi:hypothetical protein
MAGQGCFQTFSDPAEVVKRVTPRLDAASEARSLCLACGDRRGLPSVGLNNEWALVARKSLVFCIDSTLTRVFVFRG